MHRLAERGEVLRRPERATGAERGPVARLRLVHQVSEYDRERGISYWTKNYRTGIELDDNEALTRRYPYYDPIGTLPEAGQRWWTERADA